MEKNNENKQEEQQTPNETSGYWFEESQTPNYRTLSKLETISFKDKSPFQTIEIIETTEFGKTLVLDYKTQSAKLDEFIYHESLVHPALMWHKNPKSVYIGGGGELATAREILRHPSVEKCVMVDIDQLVVDISRQQLPSWGNGAFDDPRFEVYYEDAYGYLQNYDGKFDVIVMDIADPIEAGPGYVLYTEEFYNLAKTKLNPGGVIVTQSGPGSVHNILECCTAIHNTLKQCFDNVLPYTSDIPSFGSNWAFNMAYDNCEGQLNGDEWRSINPTQLDERIDSRNLNGELKFYDGIAHQGIFGVPKWLRKRIKEEDRVIQIDNPVFMY